jgi:hypothetical protein
MGVREDLVHVFNHVVSRVDPESVAGHVRRTTPHESPALAAFEAMDMDERWVTRSPEAMLDSFHWFRGEGFHLIVEDLVRLPKDPPVVVEGFRLLPDLVHPLLADPRRAVWLLPTPAVRYAAFESQLVVGDCRQERATRRRRSRTCRSAIGCSPRRWPPIRGRSRPPARKRAGAALGATPALQDCGATPPREPAG